jgi:DNA topoisomerase I
MSKNLVIVESPAKAKMISKFLGKEYTVRASMGHVRDLPDRKAEMTPAQQKKYPAIAIDIENDFEPIYVIKEAKKKVVKELKEYMKETPTVWIATDEDREGEAIGYHLLHILKVDPKTANRIVFHEITKDAILKSLDNPRRIDTNLFNAQQARRILDRLVGYTLSPLLWKKIRYGLSAGRVQSVAVRLIVDREKEIEAFNPDEFWKLSAYYQNPDFDAELSHVNGKKLDNKKSKVASDAEMSKVLAGLEGKEHEITDIQEKDSKSSPAPPFTTSTLQQEAGRKLGFSVKQTMSIAQRLYEGNVKKAGHEGGFITYMRTDSVHLADQALKQAKEVIQQEYGKEYTLDSPRKYKTKSKGAQEAHEAIRPTNLGLKPSQAAQYLDANQLKLYSLIWKRTLACQMAEAKLKKTTLTITAGPQGVASRMLRSGESEERVSGAKGTEVPKVGGGNGGTTFGASVNEGPIYNFESKGQVIVFPGFMKVYTEGSDNPEEALQSKDKILPPVKVGQKLQLDENENLKAHYAGEELDPYKSVKPLIDGLVPQQNFTKPPPRYTEASLVKKMESLGIGRPSTYAPTISTIIGRKYVEINEDKKLIPTDTGRVVNDFLVEHFQKVLDYQFTADVEEDLDKVAEGEKEWVPLLKEFFTPFKKKVDEKDKSVKKEDLIKETTDEKCAECKKDMQIKLGRFGKFLSCSDFPECKYAKPILKEGEEPPPEPEKTGIKCPDCQEELIKRQGPYGPFTGCSGYPKCKYIKSELKKIGVKCPKCGEDLIEKMTRRKKVFFACNGYPKCENAFWSKPVSDSCPNCGDKQLLVEKMLKTGKKITCPECKLEK